MAQTNVQAFSGDVAISSNLAVSGNLNATGSLAQGGQKIYPERRWEVDLSSGTSTSNFYPLYLETEARDANIGPYMFPVSFRVVGDGLGGSDSFNEETLVGYARGGGASDHVGMCKVHSRRYQGDEFRCLGIWEGTNNQLGIVIYLRGGYKYSLITDATDVVVNKSSYSKSNSTWAVKNASKTDVVGTSVGIGELQDVSAFGPVGEVSSFTGSLILPDSTARLGIGKTDPGTALDVVGTVTATSYEGSGANLTGISAGYNAAVDTIKIGNGAGTTGQGANSVAIGHDAGKTGQGADAVAVGLNAGKTGQGDRAVAVGQGAGLTSQSYNSVAVGQAAGYTSQAFNAVAVGQAAGYTSQGAYAVAVGHLAGSNRQGIAAVAVGYYAGLTSQGQFAVAIGYDSGTTGQPANTTRFRYGSIRDAFGTEYLHVTNAGEFVRGNGYSDDRLKYDEKFITGAIKSIFKLRPQEYLKKPKLIPDPNHDEEWIHESGLMAQEVYYSAPELRHLVRVAETAGDIDTLTPAPSDDPSQDPDYSVWGDKPSGIKYIQFIPYLIKGIQEIVTELPRSKTTVSNTWDQNITGLVVSADTNTHKTNVTPIVSLSNVAMDKAWYGVVSDQKTDTNDYDTLVDTNGDTRIWVSDVGGSLESGDLVTTSNIAPGYTQKQSDDIVRNYTVGKVTQECDFTEPLQVSVKIPKKELSNVKYYVKNIIREVELYEYELYNSRHTTVETTPMYICEVQENEEHNRGRHYLGGVEVGTPSDDAITRFFLEKKPDEYELLDDEEKAKYTLSTRNIYKVHSQTRSTRLIPEHEEEVFIEEMADVLDANGQIVWEDTANTAPMYTLVDHGTHKAALLTCKLY